MKEAFPDESRREFIKTSALAATGLTLGLTGVSAASYARIKGANDRVQNGFYWRR